MDYEAEIKVNQFFGDIWRPFIKKEERNMQKKNKFKIIKTVIKTFGLKFHVSPFKVILL